jgi:hypothetical protein
MSDEEIEETLRKVGSVCGKIGKGILIAGIGLAIGIPFLNLLAGNEKYPLE